MKILCNACEAAEARVMCCADEAALCLACDEKVHAANKLAGKHQRAPLLAGGSVTGGFGGGCSSSPAPKCDICQEASSYFFCLEDRAVLCRQCDVSVHTANPYVSAHQRFLLTGVRVGLEPFEPVASLAKEQPNPTRRSVESPTKSYLERGPPMSLSVETNGAFSGQIGKDGGLEASKLSFSGVTMAGSIPDWPLDEFFGFTDFNQHLGFTEHASSKGDCAKLGSSEGSPHSRSADEELDVDECLGQVPEISWTVPEIPSPATASGLNWLRDLRYPASRNEMYVPDIGSFQDPHSHRATGVGSKRRRPC